MQLQVCKRECMEHQEDKCQPRCMRLKVEASAELGVRSPFFPPLFELLELCISHTALSENHFSSVLEPLSF
jgi:hypothetical protein